MTPAARADRQPLEQRIESRLHVGAGDPSHFSVSIPVGDDERRAEESPGAERGDDARELHDAKDVAATKLFSVDEGQEERVRPCRPGATLRQHDDPLAQQRIARELGQRLIEVAEVVDRIVRGRVVAEIVGEKALMLSAAPEVGEAAAERREDTDCGATRVAGHRRVSA